MLRNSMAYWPGRRCQGCLGPWLEPAAASHKDTRHDANVQGVMLKSSQKAFAEVKEARLGEEIPCLGSSPLKKGRAQLRVKHRLQQKNHCCGCVSALFSAGLTATASF